METGYRIYCRACGARFAPRRQKDLVSGLTDGKDKKKIKRIGVSIAVVKLIAAFIDLRPNPFNIARLAGRAFRVVISQGLSDLKNSSEKAHERG